MREWIVWFVLENVWVFLIECFNLEDEREDLIVKENDNLFK